MELLSECIYQIRYKLNAVSKELLYASFFSVDGMVKAILFPDDEKNSIKELKIYQPKQCLLTIMEITKIKLDGNELPFILKMYSFCSLFNLCLVTLLNTIYKASMSSLINTKNLEDNTFVFYF